jgi:isopenicillin N synthase-like dioxygenase
MGEHVVSCVTIGIRHIEHKIICLFSIKRVKLNIWVPETTLLGFQHFMKEFYSSCWDSPKSVLRPLALGLGLDDTHKEFQFKFHEETVHQLGIRHSPPPTKAQRVEDGKPDRLGAYSGFDYFTVLCQDSNGGLQVKVQGTGMWTSVMPIEDAC